jgi:hypothetical protein
MLGSVHGDRATGGASTRARSSHRALQAQTSRDIHPDIEIHYHVTVPRLARDVQLLVLRGVPTARSPCAGSTSSRPAGPGVPPLAPTTQLLFAHLPPHHASSQAPPPTTTTHSSPPADRQTPHPGSHASLCVLSTTLVCWGHRAQLAPQHMLNMLYA